MFVDTEQRPAGEPAKVGTLKLSEAIRIGSRMRPQIRSAYIAAHGSCAVGAAWEGAGQSAEACMGHKVRDYFGVHDRLISQIVNKNDNGETREEIADWLESQGF